MNVEARSETPGSVDGVWLGTTVVVLGATLACIWVPEVPPLQDLPVHLLFAVIRSDPATFAGSWEAVPALTNQGFPWLARLFMWGGPVFAAKSALSVIAASYFVAFGIAGAIFDRDDDDEPRSWFRAAPMATVLAGPCFAGFVLAMGFAGFLLAVAVAVLGVALIHRAAVRGRAVAWAVASGALLLCSVFHVVAALMAVCQAGLVVLLVHGRRRPKAIGAALVAVTPALVYAGWTMRGAFSDYVAAGVVERTPPTRLPLAEQLTNVVATSFGGYSSLGVLAFAALVLLVVGIPRGRRGLLAASAAAWTVGYFVVPFHGLGWAFAQPRPLLAGVAFVAVLGGGARWRTGRLMAAAVLSTTYLITWCAGALDAGATLGVVIEEFGEAEPGVTTVAPLDSMRSPHSNWVEAGLHVGAYALMNGGVSNGLVGFSDTVHAARPIPPAQGFGTRLPQDLGVMFDCEIWEACADAARDVTDRIALSAATLDSVVVVGLPDDVRERLALRGLVAVAGASPLASATRGTVVELAPTELQVVIEDAALLSGNTVEIKVGFEGPIGWFRTISRSPDEPLLETARFDGLPAGPIALGIWVDGEARTLRRVSLRPGVNVETTTPTD